MQDYLKYAIQVGMIPVHVFVSTLLQAARSPELHTPTTLEMLCNVALNAHYSSRLPPIGSVVPYSELPIAVLGTVRDGLALLRTAHTLHLSHRLTTLASELVVLLLSCAGNINISQVPTAEAMMHFAYANDMFQIMDLSDDVRHFLEGFVVSLSVVIGDDAKVAREAQMMQSIQLAIGKGDILGPSSDTDIVTFSLILHHFVCFT